MIQNIPIEKILFLDIETVPSQSSWENLSEAEQKLWDKKTFHQRKEEISAADFYPERAGIMAEFGKIICISVGMIDKNNSLKIKSFANDDEKKLLNEFGEMFNSPRLHDVLLCAHNGKEFDFPWIARRFLINGMMPPQPFQMFGKNLGKSHILTPWNCGNSGITNLLFPWNFWLMFLKFRHQKMI